MQTFQESGWKNYIKHFRFCTAHWDALKAPRSSFIPSAKTLETARQDFRLSIFKSGHGGWSKKLLDGFSTLGLGPVTFFE